MILVVFSNLLTIICFYDSGIALILLNCFYMHWCECSGKSDSLGVILTLNLRRVAMQLAFRSQCSPHSFLEFKQNERTCCWHILFLYIPIWYWFSPSLLHSFLLQCKWAQHSLPFCDRAPYNEILPLADCFSKSDFVSDFITSVQQLLFSFTDFD